MLDICIYQAHNGICLTYAERSMRTVSIFKNGKNQAVRLPKDMEFQGVTELEIIRNGDTITLRPARPDWLSLSECEKADSDFLIERLPVISDEGRFDQ